MQTRRVMFYRNGEIAMKLMEQVLGACRAMHYAHMTEECYVAWIEDFQRFHQERAGKWIHPRKLREVKPLSLPN